MAKIPLWPSHPERVCWGCDRYCPADDLACGNGTIRAAHPCELFGHEWLELSVKCKNGTADALASPYMQKPDGYYTADEARSA